tara:strand:- start:881 stop:1006 length:126 start_codon:yes stop_codon:yes gene_type:complete
MNTKQLNQEINEWLKRGSSLDDYFNYKISIGEESDLYEEEE